MAFQSDYLPTNSPDYFPVRYHAVEGSPRRNRVRYLTCSDPVCARVEEITDNGRTELPCTIVARKFKQKGWTVGRDRAHDTCPTCAANARAARRKTKEVELKIVRPNPTDPVVTLGTPSVPREVKAEPPEPMSRDERRIVFSKIEEHWAGEADGYTTPWTDQKIATDLGVPLAWVVEVRSDFFGEIRDNSEIRELLSKVDRATVEASQVVGEAEAFMKTTVTPAIQRAQHLNTQIADLRKSVEGLIAIASRIERSIK